MIVEFSVVDTKDFTIEHLFDSPENQDLIANFQATNSTRIRTPKRKSWGSIHSRSLFYRLCKGCRSMSALAPCISTPCQKKS